MGKKISLPVVGAEPLIPASLPKPRSPGGSVVDEIDAEVKGNKLIIYMKGNPQQPMCGFSARAVQILNTLGHPYEAVNVLEDPQKREAIKRYQDWPTIPQVYLGGELLGGSDLLSEMYENGELQKAVEAVFAG